MKPTKRPFVLLSLALVICITMIAIIISKTVLKQDSPVKPEISRQADSRKHDRTNTGDSSRQADSVAIQHDGNPASQFSSKSASVQLTPSQVAGRVFPAADLEMLVKHLPADQLQMYQRIREEFPEVDWTEIDLTHHAFMNKREQFPLNLDEAGRVAYAAWLKEAETMSRSLVILRAQELGILLGGKENDRGYFLEGFKDGAPSYTYTSNAGSAITTGASFVRWNPGLDPALGDTINGGELYVNINDHGTIYENPQFQLPSGGGSRIIVKEINDAGVREHMTHVAGTVAAWGYSSSPSVEGMAPRAWIRSLIQQTPTHITTYAMATPGQLMVETNPRTGKLQMRSVVGNTSLGDAINTNYIDRSVTYDSLMRDYPYYVHCFSAGNDGTAGYESLDAPWSTSKNLFAIGSVDDAVRDANGAYVSGATISTFSGRGPAYDGRIKPDFVGQGNYTFSTYNATTNAGMAGTSMSSPNVAGSVAVLMDYVRQRLPQQYLRAATYKALLVNTTDDRGNAGPDYTYGWGLVNVHATAKIVRQQAENPSQRLIIEDSLSPSQTWTETYASDGTKPIRISIAWLDPAGTANAVGDRSPRLINDLDVRLIGPGGTVFPYVMPFVTGQGATPAFSTSLYNATAVPGDNTTDPVEQVFIAAPAGGTYTVQVTHKGALKDNQAQNFSVAVSGITSLFGVTPADGLSATGPQGGPFSHESKTYTITNNSSAPLSWSAAASPAAAWLTLTPSSGNLAGGASATVTSSFNANTLAGGTYTTDLTFNAGGATTTRPVSLLVRPMTGFAWDTIPSPRYWKSPFSVNIRAVDSTGATIRSFTGAAALTPIGAGGAAASREIGTGTGTWTYPLKTASHDARTQTIYLASELGAATRFNGLALNVAGTPGQSLGNFTVRLKHTATSKYTNDNAASWESTGWTTVYQGNATISQTGWVEFPFSTPFDYNGTNNLIVDFSFNNTSGSSDGTVLMTTKTDSRSIVYASDSANGDPLAWSARVPAGTRSTNIPNIKLLAPGAITITPTTTANFTNGVWSGLVTVNEASASMFLRASGSGFTGDSNSFVVEAKTIPTVTTWPTASSITYGQAVSASTLSGGSASVPGSFSFGNPTAMLQASAHSVAVVFTPTDSVTYGAVDGMVSLVVNKAVPAVSAWPTASSILYGQALSASTLSGGTASTAGTFSFVAPATVPNPGSYSAAVRFTPTDTANFNTLDGSVPVSVAKQTPTVTAWPSASGIVYGQALSASNLTGGSASVAGTYAFNAPGTTPNTGTYSAAVTFTPTDLTNYATVGGNVNVVVTKAIPVITAWPTASAIEYGQVIADSVLSGGSASVPGSFVFAEGGSGFTGSDSFTFKVNDGTVDSAPATVDIAVGTVGQSVPQGGAVPLAVPASTTATSITDIYITCDNGYELYVNGTLLGSGSNWQSAGRYQNTALQVGRNVVAIKGIDADGAAAMLAEIVLDGQRIGSSATWKVSLTAPADWKEPGCDDSAWATATDYGAYGISPWNTGVAGMPAGTPAKWIWSSNSSLDNTVYFRYVIDVISPNTSPIANAQSVTMDRNTSKAITLTGSDANSDPLTYEIVTAPTYGSLSGTAPNVTYTPPSMLDPGLHNVAVIFIPTDEAHYQTVSDTVELEVLPGSSVTVSAWPTASDITYGQPLSASTLTGGTASVPGSFAFSDPTTVFNAGTHSVAVTFTPTDTATYKPASGSATVVVGKATPVVTTWPTASAINFGQVIKNSTLSGGSASVVGAFVFAEAGTGYTGSDAFTFKVNDGIFDSAPVTVAITVGSSSPQGMLVPLDQTAPAGDSLPQAQAPTNNSFESPVLASGGYKYIPTDAGWTFSTTAGLAKNGSPWFGVAAPHGTQACFLQNTGTSVSQLVNFPTAGVYTITFSAIGRSGFGSMPTNVRVNGADVLSLTAAQIVTTSWTSFTSNTFTVSAGDHTIAFVNGTLSGDHATAIDAVQILSANVPPVANAQNVAAEPNTPKAITLTGSDPDNDALTYAIVTQPSYGTLSGTPPNVTYTPPRVLDPGLHNVAVIFTPVDTANYQTVNGTVSVNVSGGSSPYGAWTTQYPSSDLSDLNGDSDGDGLSNFQEYAFGLNPTTNSAGVIRHADGVVTGRGSPGISITNIAEVMNFAAVFGRRKDYLSAGLAYQVQFSADLAAWVTSVDTPTVVASDAEVEAVTVPYPSTIDTGQGAEKPRFFRVRVVIP